MSSYDYDILVLGGGPGGYVAAIAAAKKGKKVGLVEMDQVGGTCLNRGCIPTKALLASAHVYHDMKRAHEFGLECERPGFSFEKIMKRKEDIVARLRDGISQLLKANRVTSIQGRGRLADGHSLSVDDSKKITFDRLIIATGSRPVNLPFLPEGSPFLINSDGALRLQKLPKKLLVIGGGVIGVEMANFFAFLGCSVTIVEIMPHLLPYEDSSIGKRMAAIFKKYGIAVKTSRKVSDIREERNNGNVSVRFEGENDPATFDLVLQAAGRSRVFADLNLAAAGVATDGKKITVDEFLRTSNPDIFAIGDCASDTMLAHYASHQGICAAENAAATPGAPLSKMDAVVPSCIYTVPEVASCGLTGEKAQKAGIPVTSGKFMFNMLGRALCSQSNEGYAEIFADQASGRVVGANIIGPSATELISTVQMAIISGKKASELSEHMMFAHPTLSEGIGEALADVDKKAVHIIPPVGAARQ